MQSVTSFIFTSQMFVTLVCCCHSKWIWLLWKQQEASKSLTADYKHLFVLLSPPQVFLILKKTGLYSLYVMKTGTVWESEVPCQSRSLKKRQLFIFWSGSSSCGTTVEEDSCIGRMVVEPLKLTCAALVGLLSNQCKHFSGSRAASKVTRSKLFSCN